MATVETIYTTPEGSAPMEEVAEIEAVARQGLRGDRYMKGTGYYSGIDECGYHECEVTLIESETIEEMSEEFDIDLSDGRHRRNIVTHGVEVYGLLDQQFTIGEVPFEGTRPRPPCAHVEQIVEESGVARALKNKRGGICASVVEDGTIHVGDELEVVGELGESIGDASKNQLAD